MCPLSFPSLTPVLPPKAHTHDPLVVLGVLWVSEVKDDNTVRSGTATGLGEDVLKVNRAVEAEGAVVVDVDPVALVITRCVDDGDLQKDVSGVKSSESRGPTSPACTK